MSKFNLRTLFRTGAAAIVTDDRPTGYTHEGAPGYARDSKSELFLTAVTSMVAEDTFYESATARDARLRTLAATVGIEDGDWTLRFVTWLRTEALLRSVAVLVAAEAVRARLAAGRHGGNRALVAAALHRPDEPGEFLGYWIARYGRALPQPVKRGVADAAVRLYDERALVKYDGTARAVRFADVLELTHPRPRDPRQDALFGHAIALRQHRNDGVPQRLRLLTARRALLAVPPAERRALLAAPDAPDRLRAAGLTWEQVAGWLQGPLDAQVWTALIPTMGYMALLRNLRNFDQAGVTDEVAGVVAARLADPEQVARSRQLPLRFLSAYRSAPSLRWAWALERALAASLAGVPVLPGRTLVLVDRSGSMFGRLSRRSQLVSADAAAVFGGALAQRAARADLVEFGSSSARVAARPGESVLRIAERFGNLGGTNTAAAVQAHLRRDHDRVVIITDEQAWAGTSGEEPTRRVPDRVPVYTFNVAGYRFGHGPGGPNRHTFGGLTDTGFVAIPLLERGRAGDWPF